MGANIGTSVTNTIVAMGQIERKHEFTLAFAGATVHDFFNLFCVAVLLPLEILVGAITGSGGYLYMLSKVLTEGIGDTEAGTFTSPLKLVVAPAVKLIISADKNKIKALSLGEPVLNTCLMDDEGPLEVAGVSFGVCGNATQLPLSQAAYRGNVLDGSLVKGGAFEGADDAVAGTVSLILSLAVLCGALYLLVKQLRSLVMATAEKTLRRAANVSGPVAMLIGAVVTIAVQSSSVTTSAFTPLVGIGVVTLEQMFPVSECARAALGVVYQWFGVMALLPEVVAARRRKPPSDPCPPSYCLYRVRVCVSFPATRPPTSPRRQHRHNLHSPAGQHGDRLHRGPTDRPVPPPVQRHGHLVVLPRQAHAGAAPQGRPRHGFPHQSVPIRGAYVHPHRVRGGALHAAGPQRADRVRQRGPRCAGRTAAARRCRRRRQGGLLVEQARWQPRGRDVHRSPGDYTPRQASLGRRGRQLRWRQLCHANGGGQGEY